MTHKLNFDEDVEQDNFLFHSVKKRPHNGGGGSNSNHYVKQILDSNEVVMKVSPSPIRHVKRTKPLQANFNPFAYDAPSLISASTGSPEPSFSLQNESFDSLLQSPITKSQDQLCTEFKKTLNFGEDGFGNKFHINISGKDLSMLDSPSTPPTLVTQHSPIPTSAVRKSLRFPTQGQDYSYSRFEEEFEVLGVLGGGSFGSVYRVRKRLDGCLYAVKMVKKAVIGHSGRERILKEVYALSALGSKSENAHVVRYFTSWIDVDDRLYIQTELCDMSLEDLYKRRTSDAELEPIACDILRQLLEGLKWLHDSNVVHLDIKPANILVKNGVYKLGDLGHVTMAKFVSPDLPAPPPLRRPAAGLSQPNNNNTAPIRQMDEDNERQISAAFSVVQDVDEGDVRYMPKELLAENYDHLPKADIFSLAASVYEMFLQKTLPSTGDEWNDLRSGHLSEEALRKMSSNFKQLILAMMHPNPAKRPSAETLLMKVGVGKVLFAQEELLEEHVRREMMKGLHPSQFLLKRANTM